MRNDLAKEPATPLAWAKNEAAIKRLRGLHDYFTMSRGAGHTALMFLGSDKWREEHGPHLVLVKNRATGELREFRARKDRTVSAMILPPRSALFPVSYYELASGKMLRSDLPMAVDNSAILEILDDGLRMAMDIETAELAIGERDRVIDELAELKDSLAKRVWFLTEQNGILELLNVEAANGSVWAIVKSRLRRRFKWLIR